MNGIDKIVYALNDLNKISWFDLLQLGVTILFSAVTCWVAYLTFNLQRKVKISDDKEKELIHKRHASNVYYFLNDILYKMSDLNYEYNTFNNIVVDGKDYMDDINYLRTDIITKDEYNLLRELYVLYDGIKVAPKENEKDFKVLYKKVMDLYINPKDIPFYKNNDKIDYLASIQVLTIMKKLERILNDKINNSDSDIIVLISDKNVIIKKVYDESHYIENNNGIIGGKVKKYEIVFFFESTIRTVNELIYDGEIIDNKIEGTGKYYYHTTQNGFDSKIDSASLNKKDINYDTIAQLIKDKLSFDSDDGCFKATYEGSFKDNEITKGIIKYQLNATDKIKEKEVK